MSTGIDNRSLLVRFCDAFLQERNIKWLLGVGMLILLGSSTMLVTNHWMAYTPFWKSIVLLGYTATIHLAGQSAWHQLGLRKTGAGLMALTVLLIPLNFLALRWIHPGALLTISGLMSQVGLLVLLGTSAVFSFLAARRIFRHFLRRTQPTFLASYLGLSLSGALVPAFPEAAAPVTALVLWAVFAIGSIKVNRHVFWLTEEHRLPRIFGFFPILLLGGQFLMLFATSLASHVSREWIGLGLVLFAIPILQAADSLAAAIQKRNVESSPKLPAGVALPLFGGLCATLAGVCLSGVGYPGTFALVPTAMLAALMMGMVAGRTGHSGFVWAMLVFMTTAYQTSPVFFKELARSLMHSSAAAVHEPRLPWAFYGLTYLPLIGIFSGVAAWLARRGDRVYSAPIRHFAVALPMILLPAAFTHPKAMFPVGLALAAMFGWQTVLFRDRRLLAGAITAFVTAALGANTFATQVLLLPQTAEFPIIAWLAAGVLLAVPGGRIDSQTLRLTRDSAPRATAPMCHLASLHIAIISTVAWLSLALVDRVTPWSGWLCLGLLLFHALRWRNPILSVSSLAFPLLFAVLLAADARWSIDAQLTLATGLLTGLSLVGRWLMSRSGPAGAPHLRFTAFAAGVFGRPSLIVAEIGLIVIQLTLIPWMLLTIAGVATFSAWTAAALGLVSAAELAWRRQSRGLTVLAWVGSLALAGVATVTAIGSQSLCWVPALWAGTAVVCVPCLPRIATGTDGSKNSDPRSVWTALIWCMAVTLVAVAMASLPVLTVPLRTAGAIAVAGLLWLNFRHGSSLFTTPALILANVQLLVGVVQLMVPRVHSLVELTVPLYAPAALPVALVSAWSAVFWERRRRVSSDVDGFLSVALQLLSSGSLLSLLPFASEGLVGCQARIAVGTFLTLAGLHIWIGCRHNPVIADDPRTDPAHRQAEFHVWAGEIVLGLAVLYLALFGVVRLADGASLFATFGAAVVAWGISEGARRTQRFSILDRPFRITAQLLPALTVILGLGRHFTTIQPDWKGINSLALLLAAGFYFWRGLEARKTGFLLGSAVILNLSLAMLWRELRWSDPQLFLVPLGISVMGLVELLREQIPVKLHDPLRYAGALTILISPTFQIVGGSWLHLATLMIASVGIVLLAMGLRVRALMYTGTAFLIADLIAMVVRGSLDHPNSLWFTGIAVGAAVIALAAYCERHREQMLQRLRRIATQLETWN